MSIRRLEDYHISFEEYACKHCGKLPVDFYDDDREIDLIYTVLFRGFLKIREAVGHPVTINSGYRCVEYQKELFLKDPKAAFLSPHVFGMALDLGCDTREEADQITQIARGLRPRPRIGWKGYGGRFVHIDYAYMIAPRPTPNFKEGLEW